MNYLSTRRKFIRNATLAGMGIAVSNAVSSQLFRQNKASENKRIGIIGLDTSHCIAFTQALNSPQAGPEYKGYKVVAAYPKGSNDIKSSFERIPGYTEEIKKLNVEIVQSVEELLTKVDVVLLETNDGRLHLEQALKVIKAGKPMFIDKPIAASLVDAIAIFNAAKAAKVPIFSSSSLRFTPTVQDVILNNKVGKVLGAEAYSPMKLETTHPDLFWYGIHGVEILFTLMGTGCKQVSRIHSLDNDVVVGIWDDNRIGTFRGIQVGKQDYGGTVFGEKGVVHVGPYVGYNPLLLKIVDFFETLIPPVSEKETLEIYAFMEAADESKNHGGAIVSVDDIFKRAYKKK